MILGREPSLILALVSQILTASVAFGLDLSADQVVYLNALAAAVVGVVVRSQVTPVA